MVQSTLLFLLAISWTLQVTGAIELFMASFRKTTNGFTYHDNVFGNATHTGFSSGHHTTLNNGELSVKVGGVDNQTIRYMSGGWMRDFILPNRSNVVIDVRYSMNLSSAYEYNEFNKVLCSVDGKLFGKNRNIKYVEEIVGTGRGGVTGIGFPPIVIQSKWVKILVNSLRAGPHRLILGAYNNKKSFFNEESQVTFYDINLHYIPISVPARPAPRAPVFSTTLKPANAAPVFLPTKNPTKAPLLPPIKNPTRVISKSPPTAAKSKSPVQPQFSAPSAATTKAPVTKRPVQSPFSLQNTAPISVSSPTSGPNVIRINAGSDTSYVAPNGDVWISDANFRTTGQIFNQCPIDINGTDMDGLYCKERFYNMWLDPMAKFQFTIPVDKIGTYLLKLHFAETYYTSPQQRIFDILVNGAKIVKGLDIYSKVGYATALVVPIVTRITESKIIIDLVGKVENPKICGIEVMEWISTSPLPPTEVPVARPEEILINCGGTLFDELYSDRTWEADQYYTGGLPYNDGSSNILNTVDDQLYQTERYGEFQYDIPVSKNGPYTIKLHFAELYWDEAGQRLFNIYIENDIRELNFDILGNSSQYTAVTMEWNNVTVTDQVITIALANVDPQIDHPKLSGIEILGQ